MKVLIGCEFSGRVRDAFRIRGHKAYSCDLITWEHDPHPEWHIQGDVLALLHHDWTLAVFFPPCDHLATSGARWFAEKRADGRQQYALRFVQMLMEASIPRIAIENPVGIISTAIRKPDQVIQPWMFGDPYQKTTCLWLKNLPLLIPDVTARPPEIQRVASGEGHSHLYQPGQTRYEDSTGRKNRALMRSLTFPGFARAMSEQWNEGEIS